MDLPSTGFYPESGHLPKISSFNTGICEWRIVLILRPETNIKVLQTLSAPAEITPHCRCWACNSHLQSRDFLYPKDHPGCLRRAHQEGSPGSRRSSVLRSFLVWHFHPKIFTFSQCPHLTQVGIFGAWLFWEFAEFSTLPLFFSFSRSLSYCWHTMKGVRAYVVSLVWLFVILWTVVCQTPLSMGFSRQEYWSRLPFPPPGDLLNPGIEPVSPPSQADALPLSHQGNLTQKVYALIFSNKWPIQLFCFVRNFWNGKLNS